MTKYLVGLLLAGATALIIQVLPHQASQLGDGVSPEEARFSTREPRERARVIDGDTIEISGQRIRLEGIDAPEIHQACPTRSQGEWPAGKVAAAHLARLLAKGQVRCRATGRDSYRRLLGRCTVDGQDVNAAMIRAGMAWAFRKYSQSYVPDERVARRAGHGIWARQCQPAWDYRANRWQVAEGEAPEGCAIKGNITRRGRIYHMPWSHWYGRTKIETERGERWFCNERQALDAGWRPALVR